MFKISYFIVIISPLLKQTFEKSVNKKQYFDGVLTEEVLLDWFSEQEYRINLTSEEIKSIEDNAFIAFTNLEYLILRANEIEKISSKTFKGLKNLYQLDLDDNQIKMIEDNAFVDLENLDKFWFSNNKIEEINGGTFKVLNALTR